MKMDLFAAFAASACFRSAIALTNGEDQNVSFNRPAQIKIWTKGKTIPNPEGDLMDSFTVDTVGPADHHHSWFEDVLLRDVPQAQKYQCNFAKAQSLARLGQQPGLGNGWRVELLSNDFMQSGGDLVTKRMDQNCSHLEAARLTERNASSPFICPFATWCSISEDGKEKWFHCLVARSSDSDSASGVSKRSTNSLAGWLEVNESLPAENRFLSTRHIAIVAHAVLVAADLLERNDMSHVVLTTRNIFVNAAYKRKKGAFDIQDIVVGGLGFVAGAQMSQKALWAELDGSLRPADKMLGPFVSLGRIMEKMQHGVSALQCTRKTRDAPFRAWNADKKMWGKKWVEYRQDFVESLKVHFLAAMWQNPDDMHLLATALSQILADLDHESENRANMVGKTKFWHSKAAKRVKDADAKLQEMRKGQSWSWDVKKVQIKEYCRLVNDRLSSRNKTFSLVLTNCDKIDTIKTWTRYKEGAVQSVQVRGIRQKMIAPESASQQPWKKQVMVALRPWKLKKSTDPMAAVTPLIEEFTTLMLKGFDGSAQRALEKGLFYCLPETHFCVKKAEENGIATKAKKDKKDKEAAAQNGTAQQNLRQESQAEVKMGSQMAKEDAAQKPVLELVKMQ